MPYIPTNSPHYEYARRVARGEIPAKVRLDLGVKPDTARKWEWRLRNMAERETGTRYAYAVAAFLATCEMAEPFTRITPEERKSIPAEDKQCI